MVSSNLPLESPLTVRKPSRKPLYAQAYALYCEGKLTIAEIASKVGLPPDLLAKTAMTQRWVERRALLAGATACEIVESRVAMQNKVDATLCRATEEAANVLAASYVTTIKRICELSVEAEQEHPDIVLGKQEARRQHVHRLRERIELQKLATEGLREMIATAQQVGLLRVDSRGVRGNTQDEAPIDLAKLTQLRILVEAAPARPAEKRAETAIEMPTNASAA